MSRAKRHDLLKQFVIYGSLGFVLAMVAMGRTSWVMGVLAALIAILSRVTQLMVYFPFLKKFFPNATEPKDEKSSTQQNGMTKEQAAEILGVEVTASHDEIRVAHKRLIQKLHPDTGGSVALAKQINQAKDVLIG